MEDTALPEEPGPEDIPLVQEVRDGVGVLGQARREQNALVQLAHLLEKLINKGSF